MATFSDVVNVALSTVWFEDFATAQRFDLTDSWQTNNCHTTAYSHSVDGQTAYDSAVNNDLCVSSSAATKALLLDSTAMCAGFVKSVHYTVTHGNDAAASITNVTAVVTVTDVPMSITGMDTAVTVTQSFGVSFFSRSQATLSAFNGNLVNR